MRHSAAAPQLRWNSTYNLIERIISGSLLVLKKYTIAIKQVSSARTDQLIIVEVEVLQLRELPNLGRDCTCQHNFQSQGN